MRGLLAAGLVACLGARLLANAVPATAPRASEYSVKAALIFNIARFVTWPSTAFSSPSAPITVCVLGADPFGSALDDALKGKQLGGHGLAVRRVAEPDASCHILFVSSSESKRLGVIVEKVQKSSVLTVSDHEGFCRTGGVVELFTEQDSIHFVINARAADPGLKFSARLLDIAAREREHSCGGGR
jgi:hypothetical protein